MGHTEEKTPSNSRAPAKRHIRNYLIDRRFQLRWMFRVIVIISIIVAIMGYFLYQTIADATDQMLAQKLGDVELTDESVAAFVDQAANDKEITIYTLIIWLCSLVVFISLVTIALTHRIAGPIYKMRKIFASIDGDNLCLWDNRLRKGDELKEAFEDFDDMLRRLREHRRDDAATLEIIRSSISDVESCKEATDQLDRLLKKYHKSVQMN
jgi:hypothetical protein